MSDRHPTLTRRRLRMTRFKALLAGGLVLGLGAAITLAAWNDSEFATGTFTAGSFNIQGSIDGSAWAEHASSGAAAEVTFSTGFDNLSASQTVAAPFVLRLDAASDYDSTVTVNSAVGSGTAETELTYEIIQVASVVACTPSATPNTAQIVPAGTVLDSVTGATSFSLTKSTNGTDPGASYFLCIQVTASADLVQGTSATGTWEFLATSA